jgi:toluene monooxygenase electron transfer component
LKITINKKETVRDFECRSGERILYSGLRQGLSLPHECATGTCGTCKATLESGSLTNLWPDAPASSKLKASKNEFLMCQNSAKSDCQIKFRSSLVEIADAPDYYDGTIIETDMLTRDVIRVVVEFLKPMPFSPGQFVVFNIKGLEGGRAYSMVNAIDEGVQYEFIIKQLPSGGFSNWLFEKSREGEEVSIFGPLGNAVLKPEDDKNIFCITGGSGIAGIVSLLTEAVQNKYFTNRKGHLFFGVRTFQDLFFHNRLLDLHEKSNRNLSITFAFSQNNIPESPGFKNSKIDYLKGDVTPIALEKMSGNFDNTLAFLAGPPMMVEDAIKRLVLECDFPANDIRYDKFG